MSTAAELIDEVQRKVADLLAQSPARDLEKNVRAIMTQGFAKLDLVTREEFELQREVLARTRERLEALEARVTELERNGSGNTSAS